MRYGFVDEAHRVMRAQLDVAATLGGRLPELFAGFRRGRPASPAAYPTSCSPQAWAAAAPLLWLRSLLRLEPDVPHGEVSLEPALPAWLPRLHVEDVEIGAQTVTIDVTEGRGTCSGLGPLRRTGGHRPSVRRD
jgi:glycogen debranching enzyme